jgi:hypothetical protein
MSAIRSRFRPSRFEQNLGLQVGIVLQNVTRQLDTAFIAAMPGIDRIGPNPGPLPAGSYTVKTASEPHPGSGADPHRSPPATGTPSGNGHNNGKPGGAFAARQAADTTHLDTVMGPGAGHERIELRYRSGPNAFGGTMAMLLDGGGRLLVCCPISGMMPASLKPTAATQPLGDNAPGFRIRNAGGWDLTAPGIQNAGKVKAFFAGFNPANAFTPMGDPRIAPACTHPTQPLPAGCNEINGFDTFMAGPFTTMLGLPVGGTLALLPKATSVKHHVRAHDGYGLDRARRLAPAAGWPLQRHADGHGLRHRSASRRSVGFCATSVSWRVPTRSGRTAPAASSSTPRSSA